MWKGRSMAVFLSVLLVILKILVIILCVLILLLLVPIFGKMSGSIKLEGDLEKGLEQFLSEGSDNDDKDVFFSWEYDFNVHCSFLLGLASFFVDRSLEPEFKILGIKVQPKSGSKERPKKEKEKEVAVKAQQEQSDDRKKAESSEKRIGFFGGHGRTILSSSSLREKVFGAVKSLYKMLHIDGHLIVEFDLANPAYTGMTYGFISAFISVLGLENVAFYPRFDLDGALLSASFSASAWLLPMQVLLLMIRLMLDPETRKLRKKKKEMPPDDLTRE